MSVDSRKASSRPIGVASVIVGGAINEKSVFSKLVILTGEKDALNTENGRLCFLDALYLLARVVGRLTVILPNDVEQLAVKVNDFKINGWTQGEFKVVNGAVISEDLDADAVLSIGSASNISDNWTTVNNNGWVARVSSGCFSLPADMEQTNAISALMAASLGVTEMFKRIIGVDSKVAPLIDKIEFSLFEQAPCKGILGPELPEKIKLPDTLILGGGAIGNGITLLASQLPLEGRVHIIDQQDYGDENLGTCLLMEKNGWSGKPKATRLSEWLLSNSDLAVTGEKNKIASAEMADAGTNFNAELILCGLDNPDARRDAQNLWPSIIVDGGINEVGAAVVQHRHGKSLACLRCWFEEGKTNEQELQSKVTGLSIESLSDMNRVLTESDIEEAVFAKREKLRQHKLDGKTICSIISEAMLSTRLGVDAEDGFKPSAPFIASIASAMVFAEAIKALVFPGAPYASKFQIGNTFIDIEATSIKLNLKPLASCRCVVQSKLIDKIKNKRKRNK